jgi:UDP-hydrolysing UDP-N-acetyl-D-glucosamine 2-epimerase
MKNKFSIYLFTTTRADFGLLKNLILEILKVKKIKLRIIATGSHLEKLNGSTIKEIKNSKIEIYKKFKIYDKFNGKSEEIAKSISILIGKVSNLLEKKPCDLIIVLGDRYEVFSIAIASFISRIPIAHIQGGELTVGAIDDSTRHAITKLSHYHFVTNLEHKNRVMQLGEDPKRIFNVGALGIDSVMNTKFISKIELEKILKIKFEKKILMVTIHPETQIKNYNNKLIREVMKALNSLNDTTIIMTSPGLDHEFKFVNDEIKNNLGKNIHYFKSLGQRIYLSCVNISDGVLGNSSSGIIEVPFLKKPSINVGDRQKGRPLANSIINVKAKKDDIIRAINIIFSKKFRKKILRNKKKDLFGKGNSARKITTILSKIKINSNLSKRFYDI